MTLPVSTDLPLNRAAVALGVSAPTLRRWIRNGAPCTALGSVGRGHGSRVDVEAVRAWRLRSLGAAAPPGDLLQKIAAALGDVLRRDDGSGLPTHIRLKVHKDAAAELIFQAYRRVARVVDPQIDHE